MQLDKYELNRLYNEDCNPKIGNRFCEIEVLGDIDIDNLPNQELIKALVKKEVEK